MFGASFLTCLLTLLCLVGTASAHAAISQCRDDAGRTHFMQYDCPSGMVRIRPDQERSNLLSVVVTPPLSQAEKQRLDELDRSLARDRLERARSRARADRERAKQAAEDARQCREATRRLENLAANRRKGYRVTEEARLEAEQAKWRAIRKDSC